MSMYQVVMRLARNPGFPDGDDNQGYVVTAPLDVDDRLDLKAWRENSEACTVVRFKSGEERDADGLLKHNGAHWFFHYDEAREGDDEPVYRLGDHRLSIGEYVTIKENDGATLTYRVTQRTSVQPHLKSSAPKEIAR